MLTSVRALQKTHLQRRALLLRHRLRPLRLAAAAKGCMGGLPPSMNA